MDYRIEVIVKDVTLGDVQPLLDYLDEQGPDYDVQRGDYTVQVTQRENESRQWFYVTDDDEPS